MRIDIGAEVDAIKTALVKRARSEPVRAAALAEAYIRASVARAVSVTAATELPPTAMKSSQISLLVSVLAYFEDVPTQDELAALLRITGSSAKSLLSEVLAASDEAADRLLKSVFGRAELGNDRAPDDAPIPLAFEWTFRTVSDLNLAKSRLEFANIRYRTISSTDGNYVLHVDPQLDPGDI